MKNRACIVYNYQYETQYGINGRSYQVKVEHFYQMVWRDGLLTFLWLGKNKIDDRYVKDPEIAWRYANGVGYNDITLNAEQICKIEVYMPDPDNTAQHLLIEIEETENGKSCLKEHDFYIKTDCAAHDLDEIRKFTNQAQIELVEVTRWEDIGTTGKALLLGMIGLWVFAILAWQLAISQTSAQTFFLLLTLVPAILVYLMMILFERHLVSCQRREHRSLGEFAQISLFVLSLLSLFMSGPSEALSGWTFWFQALMLFAVLAGIFLLGVRSWRLKPEDWRFPLVSTLILSFAIVRHVSCLLA